MFVHNIYIMSASLFVYNLNVGCIFLLLTELNSFRKKYGSSLFRAFITGTDNFLVYLFDKTPWRGPLHVGWDITFRCNFKCGYCSVDKMVDTNKKELTTEEAIKFVREAGKAGVWILSITGGEPLLRPDLPSIITEAKKAGLNVNVNTNASLLKKRAQELIDSGVDAITISVESHTPDVHNEIRAFQHSFQLIIDSINELKRLRKGKKPHIMVRSVVSKKNYKLLDNFISFWKSEVDDVIIQPIHDGYKTSFFVPHDDLLRFNKDDEADFNRVYDEVLKKHSFLNNTYFKEFSNFIFHSKDQSTRYNCFVSFFELILDSYGDVVSCTEFIKKFGNLRENSLMDIWSKNQDVRNFRKLLREGKQGCWCWYTCTGPFHTYGTKLGRFFRKIR